MTAWTGVLLPFAVTAAVLLLPGLAVGAALRLRGLLLFGSAAPLSVAVVAGTAVLAGALGIRWTLLPPLAATVLGAVVLGVLARWSAPSEAPEQAGSERRDRTAGRDPSAPDRRRRRRTRPTAWTTWGAGVVGAGVGGLLVALVVRRSIWSPDLISQAYDVVFHLNAVRFVLDTGDASSLHVGRLTAPGAATAFYPAAWHGVVSLVVQLSGVSIEVATNLTAMAVSAVVWPLAAVALTQQVLPRSPAAVAASGVIAAGLPAFPTLMLIWGVLYPTLLATALLPGVLAGVVALLRRDGAAEAAPGSSLLALVVLTTAGLFLAHPGGVFGLAVLVAPLAAGASLRWAVHAWRLPGGRPRVLSAAAATAAVLVAAAVVAVSSSLVDMTSAYVWPAQATAPQALGEALLNAPPAGRPAVVGVSVMSLVGVAVLLRQRRHRWLVAAWAAVVALYVVAQTTDTSPLTGVWYNDAYRLASLLAVPVVPLAAQGLVEIVDRLATLSAPRPAPQPAEGPALGAGSLPVLLALIAVLGPGSGMAAARYGLDVSYPAGADTAGRFLSADEVALMQRVDEVVPAGAVIANDPFQGTSLVMALGHRRPMFPHLSGRWTEQQLLVSRALDQVGTDPAVCAAVRDLGVTHLLTGGPRTFDDVERAAWFDGIRAAADSPAFELVDVAGEARLYRLTACAGA